MINKFFNYFTPKSRPGRVIFPSTGSVYIISRISNRYHSEFPDELAGKLSESQFLTMMFEINEVLEVYWPCTLCWMFSHLMIILTFGLSLLIPLICISQLETELKDLINYNNRELAKKGLIMELKKKYFSSWLEIRVLEDQREIDYESGHEGMRLHEMQDFVPQKYRVRATDQEKSDSSSEDYDMGSQECKYN
jgi:hypothetical protein